MNLDALKAALRQAAMKALAKLQSTSWGQKLIDAAGKLALKLNKTPLGPPLRKVMAKVMGWLAGPAAPVAAPKAPDQKRIRRAPRGRHVGAPPAALRHLVAGAPAARPVRRAGRAAPKAPRPRI